MSYVSGVADLTQVSVALFQRSNIIRQAIGFMETSDAADIFSWYIYSYHNMIEESFVFHWFKIKQ